MSEHTPGPKLKAENGLIYEKDGDGWTVVASCITGTPRDNELAALLAQAPKLKEQRDDLLEACEAIQPTFSGMLLERWGRPEDWRENAQGTVVYRKLRAAIAKAKGE